MDGQADTDHKWGVGWNLTAMMWKDMEAAEKLCRDLVKERAHLNAECKEDQVEQEAEWCQKEISSVLNAPTQKIRVCAKSMRWWNAEIKE